MQGNKKLQHMQEQYERRGDFFATIVGKRFVPGIDEETDEAYRRTLLQTSTELDQCNAQLAYFTRHASVVTANGATPAAARSATRPWHPRIP